MPRDIADVAEHAAGRAWDRQTDEEELLAQLDERGMTMEQYKEQCDQAAEDAAADRFEESKYD